MTNSLRKSQHIVEKYVKLIAQKGITSAVMTAKNLVYTDAIRTARSVKIKFKSPYFSMSKIL